MRTILVSCQLPLLAPVRPRAIPDIGRRLRTGLKTQLGQKVRMFVFAFFTHAITNRLLLTGPTPSRELGARSKTAPASPPFPFRHCHGFSFRWLLNALPRAARCLPPK